MMTLRQRSKTSARRAVRSAERGGFTMIELMVVVAIIAIIFAISIPSIYRQLHKDSMRQAVTDVLEACARAREHAILHQTPTSVYIQPRNRRIYVAASPVAAPAGGGGSSYSFEGDQLVEHVGGSGEVFSATLSDRIQFFYIAINEAEELQGLDEVGFAFLPNGTADQVDIVLRSEENEARGITVDVITGIASVQESRNGQR